MVAGHTAARNASQTPPDLRNALWGLFVSAAEVESDDAQIFLRELEAVSSDDLDDRLRLTSSKITVGTQGPGFRGLWDSVDSLLPFASQARDPMVGSSFLNHATYLAISRGTYKIASELAGISRTYCADLGLDFAHSFCLAHEAEASIGLRDFRVARARLIDLESVLQTREDAFLALLHRGLWLRLLIAEQGATVASAETPALPQGSLPGGPLGELLAIACVAAAGAGEASRARKLSRQAREASGTVQAVSLTNVAQLLLRLQLSSRRLSAARAIANTITDLSRMDYLDPVVLACRAYPALLQAIPTDHEAITVLSRALRLSNDHVLVRRSGVARSSVVQATGGLNDLTARELEVLDLLASGLTNREISHRLFISPSTTKVHIHHILEKLRVHTRLQAVLRYRESTDTSPA